MIFPDEKTNTVITPLSISTFMKAAGNFCKLYFKLYFRLNLENNSCKFFFLSHVADEVILSTFKFLKYTPGNKLVNKYIAQFISGNVLILSKQVN